MNSSWVISDSAKDIKPGYHDQRSREFRNTQMPPGSHQVPSVSHQGSLGSHQGLPGSHQGSPGSHQIPPGSHQMPNHQDRSALHQRSAGPPPLDYAPHGPHPYNIPGLTALMVSKPSTPQSPAMYQQRHHPGQQRQQPSGQSPTATSSVSLSTSSSTVYQDPFHSRGASHLPQQHRPVHTVGTKAPPPLILADHIGDNVAPGNTRLVPHIPTKSCLCHSCVSHFSHEKSPSQPPPQPHHLRHPGTKQDRGNEQSPHPHPSHYHPYQTPSSRRNSKDYYPHQVPPNGESLRPVVAVSGQSLPPQAIMPSYVAAHRQHDVQPGSQSQRDVPGRYYEHKSRNPSPGHYPVYPSQNIVAKPLPVDSRYVEADRHASRHPHMADIVPYEIVDSRRLPAPPRAKAPSQPLALDTAKLVVPHHPPIIHIPAESAGQSEGEQPLDLSVKPTPAHSRDTRRKTNDSTTEQHPRHDLFTEPYRSMHPEHSTPRNQVHGQYVEYDQRGPAGHHLQRLENSVDRFLPQSSPHPHPQSSPHPQMQSSPHPQMQSSPHPHMQSSPHPLMQSSPHPHMQSSPHPHMQSSPHIQARFKLSPLPSPQHQDIRGGTQDRHSGLPRSSPLLQPPESPNHRGAPSNMHPAQSPVGGYQGSLPISSASQQPSHLRTVSASPNHTYHSLSPGGHHRPESPPTPHQYGVSHKHSDPAVGSSYQRPSSHGSEQDSRTAPSMIQPARPQNSESPDDQDSQRLGVSKHEPIQNIIGSHPPSDILYLICRLCRQTYGSPYGFRKHFRNQHGFEPKAEHTIVQTISATKTAMAHTGPLDHQTHSAALEQMDKVMLSQSPFDDGNVYEDGQYHGQRRDHNISHTSQSAGNPFAYDDMKQDVVKRDVQENKLLECPECGHTFQLNDFGSYKRHCRQHSLHRSSGPFACHDCQKSFPEPGLLQEHLDTHSNFTASECGICRTFFSSPSYLAEHLQAAHGHVYHADGDKDTPDNPRRSSDDHPRKFESSDGGNIKRSSSFSGTSITPSPASHARSPLPPRSHTRSPLPHGPNYSPTVPSPAAPAGHSVSMSKRHRQFPTAEPIMFTVHTPKGLEVQKLPADAVVTTASPDSSYDEAKVDTQPSESLTQNVGTSQDISTRETDAAREKSCLESNVSSKSAVLSKPSSSEGQKPLMKDETESNSSDCCLSVESNSHSVEGSRASSPGLEDVEKFYKHKKYSRHRKRVNSEDLNETDGKVSKVEGSNPSRNDQSPFSVSSSINSGVTFRDCESSGQLSEDSNNSFKSREDGRKQEEKGAMGQEKNCTDHSGSKSKGSDIDDTKLGELSKKPGDSGNKFKWDRLTRSQAGKASQSVSYTSS
ncbi:unnamed protein product [Lymnaea stagnalis]|uniref:C2H2-type domain-containing protein n=1 Tax=Lymnaea stagnalis TaxID=6523 RepID=A0AAV2HD11_LYMST